MAGSLFVVATPIGNLEDLTFRALRILKSVDVIAAEDTRRTSRLLAHYGISRPLVSLHEHNERREAPRLADRIGHGESVALVSDAGTPGISDPGTELVRLCRQRSLPVVAVPGPSAVTAALSVTGWPAVPFTFLGFPPAGGAERRRWFERAAAAPGTLVVFEAPHRVRKTLDEASVYLKRPISVHREITKIHEEFVLWPTSDQIDEHALNDRGEFVLILGPSTQDEQPDLDADQLVSLVESLEALDYLSPGQVQAAVAGATGIPLANIRSAIKKARIWVKRQKAGAP